jgi:hypothetical protein
MPVDPETGKPTRVKIKVEDGKKARREERRARSGRAG